MRSGTPPILSLKRTLTMLEAVIADGGRSSVSDIARLAGMPVATAHRQVLTLVEAGYLAPSGKGRHVAGSRLLGLAHRLDEKQVIVNIAAPLLHRLAVQVRCTVQLGTLENDMVTYRLKTGRGASGLFTRVGMQLEAYCSGIGKVLLAHLGEEEREAYLAGGPFVALTERTITDPALLREELDRVRTRGYALDDGEIAADLRCMAVPVRGRDASTPAAISVSQMMSARNRLPDETLLTLLLDTADRISQGAFG
ncbi:IclR family transcriptional regulator [Niveispirillum sp. KHB5.9]|uniref:IclR family transcriptional regulator n=1 Tax=Niveispirillum sp. KHB5.9 TaxID=3400269 RepID=UPI003A876C30